MDYQEAIELLKGEIKCSCYRNRGYCGICTIYSELERDKIIDACKCAISAMQELKMYKDGKLCLIPEDVFKNQCEELDAYKEIGTLEEVRDAVEKQCEHCGYKIHSDNISKLNSCNDCGMKTVCKKRPDYGDYCRINGYDWSEVEE